MKRKLISVSLALALGLSLAACGSKPAPSGAETPAGELGTLSGPVELQFWHSISNQNHLKVLEGLVEEFNETIGAEKGITVVPTFNGSSSELYSSVVGAIKAGSAPDVTLALRPYVADYLQTDYVVNLEPYITDPNVGMTDYEDIFEGPGGELQLCQGGYLFPADPLLLRGALLQQDVFCRARTQCSHHLG